MFRRKKRGKSSNGARPKDGTQSANSSPSTTSKARLPKPEEDVAVRAARSASASASESTSASGRDNATASSSSSSSASSSSSSSSSPPIHSPLPLDINVKTRDRASHSVGDSVNQEDSAAVASIAAASRLRGTPGWASKSRGFKDIRGGAAIDSPSDDVQNYSFPSQGLLVGSASTELYKTRRLSARTQSMKSLTSRKPRKSESMFAQRDIQSMIQRLQKAEKDRDDLKEVLATKDQQLKSSQNQIERLSTMIIELTEQQQASADSDADRQQLLEMLTSTKMELANSALDHEQKLSKLKKEHASEKQTLLAKVEKLNGELEGAMEVIRSQQEEHQEHIRQLMEEARATLASAGEASRNSIDMRNPSSAELTIFDEGRTRSSSASPRGDSREDDSTSVRLHSAPPSASNGGSGSSDWPQGFDIDESLNIKKKDKRSTGVQFLDSSGSFVTMQRSYSRKGASFRRSESLGSLDSIGAGSFRHLTRAEESEDVDGGRNYESRIGKLGKGARKRFLKLFGDASKNSGSRVAPPSLSLQISDEGSLPLQHRQSEGNFAEMLPSPSVSLGELADVAFYEAPTKDEITRENHYNNDAIVSSSGIKASELIRALHESSKTRAELRKAKTLDVTDDSLSEKEANGEHTDEGEESRVIKDVVSLLRSVPISILRNIDSEDQEIAALWMDVQFCDAGTILFRQGAKSDVVYILMAGIPVVALKRMESVMPIVLRAGRRTGARQFRTFDAAFSAHMQNMQQQVLDCATKADYMTLVRRVLRQGRTLPLPMGVPTDLRQARKDLVRESGVYLNDELHRMGEDECVTSFERKLFGKIKELVFGQSVDRAKQDAEDPYSGNTSENAAMLQGIVHSIIIALSRTVLGGDAYARCSELFNNPNMVVLTSESQLAPPLRIEITKGRMKSGKSGDFTGQIAVPSPSKAMFQKSEVEVLGTIRIESVDVIKVSHFDIENLMDEPEIWLLLRAAVVQSFEIVRPPRGSPDSGPSPKRMDVKVSPTYRMARNITVTSHRANILSLADFGIVGIHSSNGAAGNLRTSARRRKMKRAIRRASALAEDVATSPKSTLKPMLQTIKSQENIGEDADSHTGPLRTESVVSL